MKERIHHGTQIHLERARDLIVARLDEPVSLAEAAREACLSPFHFHRLFVRTYGQTPHAFLTARRIDQAKRLLAEGDLTVTEICFSLGYESLGTFSTRFQRIVGCSPTQYRIGAARHFALSSLRPYRFIPTCFTRRHAPVVVSAPSR
ncbi:helix-turn-helix transcriptional regulator [Fimbriimonas ginsengisoli]|uniref:Transcriptional regulator, AraC family n=1 Tax=Fimbriimonas ginsengisoli Gsoil 348 TaxID=661478 RepID=A0A068NN85_FIMGI|nr:AraC family transcriptional regulator [Fimbriimonas ginsengisoli]AIE85013.1 Transcriptional regulator, AraC family [Fimbriimonas ginsengisoli Gsoil 348]